MMVLNTSLSGVYAKAFMKSTSYGPYGINVERTLRTKYDVATSASEPDPGFTDWMVYASYVNNFQYSATEIVCDGKKGAFF